MNRSEDWRYILITLYWTIRHHRYLCQDDLTLCQNVWKHLLGWYSSVGGGLMIEFDYYETYRHRDPYSLAIGTRSTITLGRVYPGIRLPSSYHYLY